MKAVPILAALCLLILAGCSSNKASDASDLASERSRGVCELFASLIEDVNAGQVRGSGTKGLTAFAIRTRITNMFGLSVYAHEPVDTAVRDLSSKAGSSKDRTSSGLEDVREQVDALRDACVQYGFPVLELQ